MTSPSAQREFEIGEAFAFGWRKFTENAGPVVGITAVMLGTAAVLGYATQAGAGSGSGFVWPLLQFVVNGLIAMAIAKFSLDIVDGRAPSLDGLFSAADRVLSFLAATFLFGLAVGIGFVLLVVPGVIAIVAFFFFGYVVIDEGAGPIAALQRSAALTRGRRGRLFLAGLAAMLINILGVMAFVVGLLVSYPITFIAAAYVYRRLQGVAVAG